MVYNIDEAQLDAANVLFDSSVGEVNVSFTFNYLKIRTFRMEMMNCYPTRHRLI